MQMELKKTNTARGMAMTKLWCTAILLLAAQFTFAAPAVVENQAELEDRLESIDSKRGLELEIDIKSEFLRSQMNQDMVPKSDPTPNKEIVGFTSLDLGFIFRPWETTSAKVIVRMASDYQLFFNTPARIVSVPWLSIDGRVGNPAVLAWSVGDFKQQYSPLTLYTPEISMLYEPLIFARPRHVAMDYIFLGNNDRVLSGADLQSRINLGDALEIRAEALATRLRRPEFLDPSGAQGFILPNEESTGLNASMDKYALAGNLEFLALNEGLYLGATFLNIFDRRETLVLETYDSTNSDTGEQDYWNEGLAHDTTAENVSVISGRFGFDLGALLESKSIVFDGVAEYALSDAKNMEVEGKAFYGEGNLGYQAESGAFSAVANVTGIMNDAEFYNPLAQSPSFTPRRIMHSDKDADFVKYGVFSPYYNSFDALYHFNPKFAPVAENLAPAEFYNSTESTESYQIASYYKSSYTNGIFEADELALLLELSDPAFQTLLPFGPATPNRMGFGGSLTLGFLENAFEITGVLRQLTEYEGSSSYGVGGEAEFSELGGGASLDFGPLLGMETPLEISGSYMKTGVSKEEVENTFDLVNGGFVYRFHPRFGILGGVQYLKQQFEKQGQAYRVMGMNVGDGFNLIHNFENNADWSAARDTLGADALLDDYIFSNNGGVYYKDGYQMQWMAGLEYYLNDLAWVTLSYGRSYTKRNYQADIRYNWTNADEDEFYSEQQTVDFSHTFEQSLIEASVNMEF